MEFLLDFFEKLDEMVYISDPESYEILYMNQHLRESLGYHTNEEYSGKKCYEVLQGVDKPCSFCTNPLLHAGEMISWTHNNPLLKKRFMIKDSLVHYNGRQYRIEIAIDVDNTGVNLTPYFYARNEHILNECLQQVFSTTNPEESLNQILAYVGTTFTCDRVYIFEFEGSLAHNTYEWCASASFPQKDVLQNVPLSSIDWWIQLFRENEVVTIPDIEELRTAYPVAYAILKPQHISQLVAGPITIEDQVVGFLGVDNPNPETLALIGPLLKIIGYFIVSLLRRRDLLHKLNVLSFHDLLTGAFNRNAMFEHIDRLLHASSVGVIYCDITALKQTNDTLGHNAGDQLIRHCYDLIHCALDTQSIYRTGGDEFVAIFQDISERDFLRKVSHLRDVVQQDRHHIAIGHTWSDRPPFHLEMLIAQADKIMYQDKRSYYSTRHQPEEPFFPPMSNELHMLRRDSLFHHFLSTTYHDMEQLFRSVSEKNTTGFFFFGDMQKDLFYISDNMRDEFGFPSNIVPGLLQAWVQRIPSAKSKKMYQQAIDDMLENKRTVHDLRYQVRSARGKLMWVRCYGLLQWNADRTVPLFFSGRVSHQDDSFVVDPVTSFPREAVLFRQLTDAANEEQSILAIGFCLNSFAEINSTRGRSYADHLLQNIAEDLIAKLSEKMAFFRLEGMRCIALVDPSCTDSQEHLIEQIRKIISGWYHITGISVQHPCSFALMHYPMPRLTPSDFLEQMVSLLRIAKHDTSQAYLEDSDVNLQRIKNISNIALALSRDVLHGMTNFRIVIQPIISAHTGKVIGGEVLLRWRFEGREISPGIFIPMLEKDNMIQLAGYWMLEQAICTCRRMLSYQPEFRLAFNISLRQISDENLGAFIQEMLEKYQLDGKHLVAEMTESCVDEQPDKLLHFVDLCNKLGIKIALDDFGNGYSSLRMLLQYPSSIIKLDRTLLAEMTESADKMSFISSIVYACHQFGKKVCMEGVETAEQDRLIREAGFDMIQGFHYYRPLEIDAMYELLSAQSSPTPDQP